MAIRALISDLGGVIFRTDGQDFIAKLAAELGRDQAELEAVERAAIHRLLIRRATFEEGSLVQIERE